MKWIDRLIIGLLRRRLLWWWWWWWCRSVVQAGRCTDITTNASQPASQPQQRAFARGLGLWGVARVCTRPEREIDSVRIPSVSR